MIVASIDLMDGRAVQLRQGRDKVLERDDPLELASEFDRYGETAVIDLDAALGRGDNEALIRELCGRTACRVGGGVRSVEAAKRYVSYGATKVIVGTKAFEGDAVNHAFLGELAAAVGRGRVIVAVDARGGEIVTKGWRHATGLDLFEAAGALAPYASELLFTCVEKEGMLGGTDLERVRRLRATVKGNLTVAGGVTTMDEVVTLAGLGVDVQLGMALYTGKIDLAEGFAASLNWKEPLIPTVTCDEAGQVLMLAYTSRDSLEKTFETGRMCYYSRSRQALWTKGETSGHTQELLRIRADCDRDALLATVRQQGVACHTESYSCFGDRRFGLTELHDVVKERIANPEPGSYTATLTDEKVREKVMEEALELVEARTRDELVWEAADVLYFVTVLLAREGIHVDDALRELRRRRRG